MSTLPVIESKTSSVADETPADAVYTIRDMMFTTLFKTFKWDWQTNHLTPNLFDSFTHYERQIEIWDDSFRKHPSESVVWTTRQLMDTMNTILRSIQTPEAFEKLMCHSIATTYGSDRLYKLISRMDRLNIFCTRYGKTQALAAKEPVPIKEKTEDENPKITGATTAMRLRKSTQTKENDTK